jgi:hypothetical protein
VDETDMDGTRMARFSVNEVRQAILDARAELKETGVEDDFTLSIMGYDTCLGSMAEIAYENRGLTEYMIASTSNVPGDGWDYRAFLSELCLDTSMSTERLCEVIVDTYVEYYDVCLGEGYEGRNKIEMDVIDVSVMEEVVEHMAVLTEDLMHDGYLEDNAYRNALISSWSDAPWVVSMGQAQPFIDLGRYLDLLGDKIPVLQDICAQASDAVNRSVVYVNSVNATYAGGMDTSGLAVYFALSWTSLSPEYLYEDAEEAAENGEYIHYGIDFCTDTYWDEFMFTLSQVYDGSLLET